MFSFGVWLHDQFTVRLINTINMLEPFIVTQPNLTLTQELITLLTGEFMIYRQIYCYKKHSGPAFTVFLKHKSFISKRPLLVMYKYKT